MNKAKRKDILKYYKREFLCKVCNGHYGSDVKHDNHVCPKCNWAGRIK